MTEVAAMQENRSALIDAAQAVVARAMDEGLTAPEIREMFAEATERENQARTQAQAERLYGPAAKSMDASPSAVAIVAKAKLPRGEYAITKPDEIAPSHVGKAIRTVEAALATGVECRLYRLDSGWRFVGIVHPDGTFTDERRPHERS